MTNETPHQRRIRETLERCTTEAQRVTCDRLHAEDKTAYTEKRQGTTVVAEFRRYCETRDPEKIRAGLYHFSIMGAGGLNDIAHYDLHGFRHEYPHPAIYLERLLFPEVDRWERPYRPDPREDPNAWHSQYVYTDGMTAGEVCAAILNVAEGFRDELIADLADKVTTKQRAEAERLAESLGMRLMPR